MQEWVEYMTFEGESPMANLRRANGRDAPWKLKYFAVGNENWGCGGNMRAEYYLDEYHRYSTYIRNFNGNFVYKVACGPNSDDYHWTEVLMADRRRTMMQGLSLHYYTVPGEWSAKGAATGFSEAEWAETLCKTLKMEEMISKHDNIMTRYDPEKRIGLIVDEWGTWYAVEPGTNPGFLNQRNTLRDAMVAAVNFNIFHAHADRVKMANIAQLANVLQSPLLTEGDKLILTPTYQVFDMYKVHQDSDSLYAAAESPEYAVGERKMPALSVSASKDKAGKIHVSMANLDPGKALSVECLLHGAQAASVAASVISASKMDAENSAADPEAVSQKPFDGHARIPGGLKIELPPKSIVTLEIG
jgi:alpha-N-arabinofuranosidase